MSGFCPECGLRNRDDASFCKSCGGPVSNAAGTAVGAATTTRSDAPPPPPEAHQLASSAPATEYDTETFDGDAPAEHAPAADSTSSAAKPVEAVLRSGHATVTGASRTINEDAVVVLSQEIVLDGSPPLKAAALAVVDGTGPAGMGAAASAAVARVLASWLNQRVLQPAIANEPLLPEALVNVLEETAKEANRQLYRLSQTAGTNLLGSITLALVLDQRVWLISVGDTRAYHIQGDEAHQITRDDSFVASLVESGDVGEEALASHPERFVLTRALGQAPDIAVKVHSTHLNPGDRLMLCSDGLWRSLGPQLDATLLAYGEPQQLCNRLMRAAIIAGSTDDASVAVLKLERGALDRDTLAAIEARQTIKHAEQGA